jgi:hypothetical protein
MRLNYSSTKKHNHDFGEWIDKYNKLWDKNKEEFELFLINNYSSFRYAT